MVVPKGTKRRTNSHEVPVESYTRHKSNKIQREIIITENTEDGESNRPRGRVEDTHFFVDPSEREKRKVVNLNEDFETT